MTYQKLFDLKFKKNLPTYKITAKYPKEAKKISRIAMLELSLKSLRELVRQEKELDKILKLKRSLLLERAEKKPVLKR